MEETKVPVQSSNYGAVLSSAEMLKIQKMLQEIVKFMEEDKITFDQLFTKRDVHKDGTITSQDFKAALFEDLYLTDNPTIEFLTNFIKNGQEKIDLVYLRKQLDQELKETDVSVKHSDAEIIPQATEMDTLEKMFQQIVNFMKEGSVTFDQLFSKKDRNNDGTVTEKDFKEVLMNELGINESPKLKLLFDFVKNEQGNVDLLTLKNHLYED